MPCEELSGRFDSSLDRTQDGDFAPNFASSNGQRDICSHNGNWRTFNFFDSLPKRSASQDDGICVGRQSQETTVRLLLQVRRKRPRILNRLAKIRADFMAEAVDPQAKSFGRVLEYAFVAIDRVQKRYTHCQFPLSDCSRLFCHFRGRIRDR
jgi:hypothetical protein